MAFEIRLMADGTRRVGDAFLGLESWPTDLVLRLFKHGLSVAVGDDLDAYEAAECDYSGYAAQDVAGWVFAGVLNGRHTWQAAPRRFEVEAAPTVGNAVGGYFVTFGGGAKLAWAQQLPGAPYPMTDFGHALILPPVLTFRSEFS